MSDPVLSSEERALLIRIRDCGVVRLEAEARAFEPAKRLEAAGWLRSVVIVGDASSFVLSGRGVGVVGEARGVHPGA